MQDSSLYGPISITASNGVQIELLPMANPKRIPLDCRVSQSDFDKLMAGYEPKDMDDKYRIIGVGDKAIRIYRAGTQKEECNFLLEKDPEGFKITALNVEQYPDPIWSFDLGRLNIILKNSLDVTIQSISS